MRHIRHRETSKVTIVTLSKVSLKTETGVAPYTDYLIRLENGHLEGQMTGGCFKVLEDSARSPVLYIDHDVSSQQYNSN